MIGRYWEDDQTWLGDCIDFKSAIVGKSCGSMPCPSFEEVTLDVTGVCICRDLAPGQMYAPGCVVHDPVAPRLR